MAPYKLFLQYQHLEHPLDIQFNVALNQNKLPVSL